jgi:hypothetical protein
LPAGRFNEFFFIPGFGLLDVDGSSESTVFFGDELEFDEGVTGVALVTVTRLTLPDFFFFL